MTRVLIAAAGDRPDDFAHGIPGEVVLLGMVCGRDEHGAGDCGCGRSFTGVTSGQVTTLAVAAEVDLTLDELADAVKANLTAAGWASLVDLDEESRGFAEEIVEIASEFAVGTRVRRRFTDAGDEIYPDEPVPRRHRPRRPPRRFR